MNITILANKDVASCVALNYLLTTLHPHQLSIFLSSRVGSKPLPEVLRQLKFVEQDLFNELLFPVQQLQPKASAQLKGFGKLAEAVDHRMAELNNINSEEGLMLFRESAPDLVLSIRYGVILKEAALAIPQHGVLNLHSGLLPAYKGVMATFWALLNGESEIGTTLHTIDDASIDTGRVVSTSSMQVDTQRSYLWHVLGLYEEGCRQMADAVAAIAQGAPMPTNPQQGQGHYFTFPTEIELERFRAKGWRLWDPQDVVDLARRFVGKPELSILQS